MESVGPRSSSSVRENDSAVYEQFRRGIFRAKETTT